MAEATENKFETVIFKKKKLGDLIEEVYNKSNNYEKIVTKIVEDLGQYLAPDDNGVAPSMYDVIPLTVPVHSFLKLGVETNDQLIKMLAVVQKCLEKPAKDKGDDDGKGGFKLTEQERKELEQLELEYSQSKVPLIPASINELKAASNKKK